MLVAVGKGHHPSLFGDEAFVLIFKDADLVVGTPLLVCWKWKLSPKDASTQNVVYHSVLASPDGTADEELKFVSKFDQDGVHYELQWPEGAVLPSKLAFQLSPTASPAEVQVLTPRPGETVKLPFPILISDFSQEGGEQSTQPRVLAFPRGATQEATFDVWGPQSHSDKQFGLASAVIKGFRTPDTSGSRSDYFFGFHWEGTELGVQHIPGTNWLSLVSSSDHTTQADVQELCRLRSPQGTVPIPVFGAERRKVIVHNDTEDVFRVKITNSGIHPFEQWTIDLLGLLPLLGEVITVGKWLVKPAAKAMGYLGAAFAGGDLLALNVGGSTEKDQALYPRERVGRFPDREHVSVDNDVTIEHFLIDGSGSLKIEIFTKEKVAGSTPGTGNITLYIGDILQGPNYKGFTRNVLTLRNNKPRRGLRLRNLMPTAKATAVQDYNQEDILSCIYGVWPAVPVDEPAGSAFLPRVQFYPFVFDDPSRQSGTQVFQFEALGDAYLIAGTMLDATDGFSLFQLQTGATIIELNNMRIMSADNGHGEQVPGTYNSEAEVQDKIDSFFSDDDPLHYGYSWKKPNLWVMAAPSPTTKRLDIKAAHQYSIHIDSTFTTFIIAGGIVEVPGLDPEHT